MRLPSVQRVAWWGGLAFFCIFLVIWLLNTSDPLPVARTHPIEQLGLPHNEPNMPNKDVGGRQKHVPVPKIMEEVELQQPVPFKGDLVVQAYPGEEIQVDSFILDKNRKKQLLEMSNSISIELETYITYKADDSLAEGLEITRCAQKGLWNGEFYKCYKAPRADKPLFHLTIWSQDYHAAAVAELQTHLEPLGVKIISKGLSPHCAIFKSCGTDLKAVTSINGITLNDDTIHRFHAEYLVDTEFASSDAFLCIRPSAMCELFMPFGKSMIVIIDARHELGRWTMQRWKQWNENLIKLSQDPKNVLAATSQYDIEYVRFFTGLNLMLLPPLCSHIIHLHQPLLQHGSTFLLFTIRSKFFVDLIMKDFKKYSMDQNATVHLVSVLKAPVNQAAQNLIKYPGIVLIPHAPSSLRMTELYRMNIPIFAPTQELLVRWHMTYGIMPDRTWQHVARLVRGSAGANMPGRLSLPNPNDEKLESVGFWMTYIDIYMWPNVIYFSSVKDLVIKLQRYSSNQALLAKVSHQMERHNRRVHRRTMRQWNSILTMLQDIKRKKHGS